MENNAKLSVVLDKHDKYGLYLWEMPDGRYVADEYGNFLNVPSVYGDPKKINNLRAAVKSFGIEEGDPVFFPGHRRVTDDEYDEQRRRLYDGLVPDENDVGVAIDDYRSGPVG